MQKIHKENAAIALTRKETQLNTDIQTRRNFYKKKTEDPKLIVPVIAKNCMNESSKYRAIFQDLKNKDRHLFSLFFYYTLKTPAKQKSSTLSAEGTAGCSLFKF
ncbi:hypothetical protein ILYODFUR_032603 [Ilyodon furcidens]|uniref:Uncharacterized protein n=1 Tax=Ilyodon furcidens TaxID=33524 RepID=A0ABV0T398_9TELE